MTPSAFDLLQVVFFAGSVAFLTPPLGRFMASVFAGKPHLLSRVTGPIERMTYRLAGISGSEQMEWKTYAGALLLFNAAGFVILFLLQEFQHVLPLNPGKLPAVPWHLAVNIAVSFMTNTNWQSYAGETTLGYLVQLAGLTVQNFVSAGTGIAVLLALTRAVGSKPGEGIGNFWADLVRATITVLLPMSLIFAIVLMWQGVPQTFGPSVRATNLEGTVVIIPRGPVASQIAIKQLGSNGGGYFNANSAHPFENPTPLTNELETIAIILLASALVYAYGSMIGSMKEARVLWSVMFLLLVAGLALSLWSEYLPTGVPGSPVRMEGKETRIGVTGSVIWSVATTDASNGSVNSMHDSLSPIAGMTSMINMMLGEVIFGGVGAGLYGMLIFVILTVFIAGLMVGRSPEYLGRKIEAFEIKMAALAVLFPSITILIFSALALLMPDGISAISNPGPHGLSQVLYAFTSASQNNGSAFGGLNTNTPFFNLSLAAAMLIGRFGVIIPVLAIAGSLSVKPRTPQSSGTFRTDTVLFGILLTGVILIVGGLTFFPALSLGPVVEHLLMTAGRTF